MDHTTEHHDSLASRVVQVIALLTGVAAAIDQWNKDVDGLQSSIAKVDSQVVGDSERATATEAMVSSLSQVRTFL